MLISQKHRKVVNEKNKPRFYVDFRPPSLFERVRYIKKYEGVRI